MAEKRTEVLTSNKDLISSLPDHVICQILSFVPTKDSVRTSALSTRWKYLYASVPFLDFQSRHFLTYPKPKFTSFVYKILDMVTKKLSHVSKFIMETRTCAEYLDIMLWIDTVTSNSVQEIDLACRFLFIGPPMPHSLFTCETLVKLCLDIPFTLSVPEIVCLPKLKELYLKRTRLRNESDDESVKRLFSSCPVLELLSIELWCSYSDKVYNITVPSLKILTVSLSEFDNYKLSINCPNLEALWYKSYAAGGYSGDNLGSLKKFYAHIIPIMRPFETGKLMELVEQVSKVEVLSLAGDAMEALLASAPLPTFENVTHLELASRSSCDNDGWQLLPRILENSPFLETLVFKEYYTGVQLFMPEHVPVCLSFHLKVIRFEVFCGNENEFKLVEYLLRSACVLEKMVIRPWSRGGVNYEIITKRLLTFHRCSKVSEIVILPPTIR